MLCASPSCHTLHTDACLPRLSEWKILADTKQWFTMCVCKQLRDLMIYTPIQWQFIHNFSWEVKSMMYFKPFLTQYACRTNFIKFLCSAPSVSNIFKLEDWNTWSSETHSRNADQCRQPASHVWLAVSIGGFIRFPKMEVPPNHPSHDHFRNPGWPGWPGWLGDPPF